MHRYLAPSSPQETLNKGLSFSNRSRTSSSTHTRKIPFEAGALWIHHNSEAPRSPTSEYLPLDKRLKTLFKEEVKKSYIWNKTDQKWVPTILKETNPAAPIKLCFDIVEENAPQRTLSTETIQLFKMIAPRVSLIEVSGKHSFAVLEQLLPAFRQIEQEKSESAQKSDLQLYLDFHQRSLNDNLDSVIKFFKAHSPIGSSWLSAVAFYDSHISDMERCAELLSQLNGIKSLRLTACSTEVRQNNEEDDSTTTQHSPVHEPSTLKTFISSLPSSLLHLDLTENFESQQRASDYLGRLLVSSDLRECFVSRNEDPNSETLRVSLDPVCFSGADAKIISGLLFADQQGLHFLDFIQKIPFQNLLTYLLDTYLVEKSLSSEGQSILRACTHLQFFHLYLDNRSLAHARAILEALPETVTEVSLLTHDSSNSSKLPLSDITECLNVLPKTVQKVFLNEQMIDLNPESIYNHLPTLKTLSSSLLCGADSSLSFLELLEQANITEEKVLSYKLHQSLSDMSPECLKNIEKLFISHIGKDSLTVDPFAFSSADDLSGALRLLPSSISQLRLAPTILADNYENNAPLVNKMPWSELADICQAVPNTVVTVIVDESIVSLSGLTSPKVSQSIERVKQWLAKTVIIEDLKFSRELQWESTTQTSTEQPQGIAQWSRYILRYHKEILNPTVDPTEDVKQLSQLMTTHCLDYITKNYLSSSQRKKWIDFKKENHKFSSATVPLKPELYMPPESYKSLRKVIRCSDLESETTPGVSCDNKSFAILFYEHMAISFWRQACKTDSKELSTQKMRELLRTNPGNVFPQIVIDTISERDFIYIRKALAAWHTNLESPDYPELHTEHLSVSPFSSRKCSPMSSGMSSSRHTPLSFSSTESLEAFSPASSQKI